MDDDAHPIINRTSILLLNDMLASLKEIQSFVDGVGASVAVVERDEADSIHVIACNQYFIDMFGVQAKLFQSTPFLLTELIPRYNRFEFVENIRECFETHQALEFKQAIDTDEGSFWWRFSVKPIINGYKDKVSQLLITGQDITAKITLENELKITNSRFESVIGAAYDCIVTIDDDENIVLFNKAAQELFGYTEDEIIGQKINLLIPKQYREIHHDHIRRFAKSPIQSREMKERGRIYGLHKNGLEFPVEIAISKINVNDKMEFTAIIRDISDKVKLLDKLSQEASHDHLTGLLNRREFEECSEKIFNNAKNLNTPLSVMMIDIDHFKSINDSYGHAVGDEVLQVLSKIGNATVRHNDLFVRLGGEEFAILMPNTNTKEGIAMAERFRRIFDEQSFEHTWSEHAIPFTVSLGVTTLKKTDHSIKDMLKRADKGLYKAKNSGRNKVEFYK